MCSCWCVFLFLKQNQFKPTNNTYASGRWACGPVAVALKAKPKWPIWPQAIRPHIGFVLCLKTKQTNNSVVVFICNTHWATVWPNCSKKKLTLFHFHNTLAA